MLPDDLTECPICGKPKRYSDTCCEVHPAVQKRAVVVVRSVLEDVANMTPEERTIASLQNQAVWVVYALAQANLLAST